MRVYGYPDLKAVEDKAPQKKPVAKKKKKDLMSSTLDSKTTSFIKQNPSPNTSSSTMDTSSSSFEKQGFRTMNGKQGIEQEFNVVKNSHG